MNVRLYNLKTFRKLFIFKSSLNARIKNLILLYLSILNYYTRILVSYEFSTCMERPTTQIPKLHKYLEHGLPADAFISLCQGHDLLYYVKIKSLWPYPHLCGIFWELVVDRDEFELICLLISILL